MRIKFIAILLLIIIICSGILIYKIEKEPEYNANVYAQVYEEFNQIINASNTYHYPEQNTNTSVSKDPIVIHKNDSGDSYRIIGAINIPKINVSYPIINECTDENLNIAPTKLLGPTINTVGNLVIVGHNNWNKDFFSNLHKLENNDTVELTDLKGNKVTYKVYDKYEVKQDNFDCLDQNTNGRTELTLITCVKYQKTKRLIVKCVAN